MNTKVDTGPNIAAMLDGLDRATDQLTGDIRRHSRACLSTLAQHIAQQDATIARMRQCLELIAEEGRDNAGAYQYTAAGHSNCVEIALTGLEPRHD